jgi:alcohol dehydrogenase
MKTGKAARIHTYGGPDTVRLEDIAIPDPKPGELVIRVQAAGVNPIDWKFRAGYLQQMMPMSLPVTLGGDFSGIVERVGTGVAGFKSGDEVYGLASVFAGGSGAFAEYVVVQGNMVAEKPRRLSYTDAAALPLAGVSAVQALTETLRVAKGQKVLIHGGAGGIGSLAIQLAKNLGAHVATTVSSPDTDFVKTLGADLIIDHTREKFEDQLKGYDAVLDTVGGDTYAHSFKVLKRGGRLVSMLEQPRADLMKEYGVEATMQFTQVTSERLTKLAQLVDQGVLKVHVDKTFPLLRAADALHSLETAPPKGKIVLQIV